MEDSNIQVDTIGGNRILLKAIAINNNGRIESRSIPTDHFASDYGFDVIEPPYDLLSLATMPESSPILGPCIDAMSVNIEGQGHRIVPRDDISRVSDEDLSAELKAEMSLVRNFFSNASLDMTFQSMRSNIRKDLELTGNAYVEIVPSIADVSVPGGMNHLPSWTMRLRRMDDESTSYEVPRSIQNNVGKWSIEAFPNKKYFRRYVQRRDIGSDKVYFKEFGDPRVIDYKTGDVLADTWDRASTTDKMNAATSIIHFKLYCPRSPYGLPRYIGALFSIFGNRAAETINYTTLKCNNVPSMIMMVTNAQLTSGSIARIKQFVEERIQGDNNYSSMLIVEAEPITEGMKDPGTMKVELKPLNEAQHQDAMFVNYITKNEGNIRRSYRMPPIFLGDSDDYTRSTADSSRKLAEEQIFYPERNAFDAIMNMTIVPALGAASVLYRSNTPNVTDNYELTQLLAVAERSGGLTPHISRIIVEDVIGRDLPDVDPSINPNIPFTMTMLREQLMYETDTTGNVVKTYSDSDIVKQLRFLKSMTDNSPGITTQTKRNLDNLIALMEMGETDHIVPIMVKQTNKTIDTPYYEVFKSNAEKRIIGGAVLVPGAADLQGDIYDKYATEEAAYYWLEHFMDSEENGIKFMHKGTCIHDAARPIQSYVLDRDTEFDVDVSATKDGHPTRALKTISYPAGTWMLYAKIRDDDLWEAIKNGEYIGWSIGGVALVQDLMKRSNG